jgi:hypothetical protein
VAVVPYSYSPLGEFYSYYSRYLPGGIARTLLRQSPFGGLADYPPGSVTPPLTTKDDLEESRTGSPAARPGGLAAAGLKPLPSHGPGHTPTSPPTTPPHIRFSFGGAPMRDYVPGETETGSIGGSFMGVGELVPGGDQGPELVPGVGGAYSPSAPWEKLSPEALAQFPSYQEGIAATLGKRAAAAEAEKLERLAEDPMWEERQRADIWAGAQAKAQEGIRGALLGAMSREALRIEQEVMADPSVPPEKKKEEIGRRLNDLSMFGSGVRPATVGGYPDVER